MRALFVGGTGTISTSVTRLAISRGWEVYVLNRGIRNEKLADVTGVNYIYSDINNEDEVRSKIKGMYFDVVANFINFVPSQVERDIRLFSGITNQYFFISSASAYQKPPATPIITESTPLYNPYWQYSRDKIACEDLLINEYRKNGFPVTIIRPSHTYDEYSTPVALHGKKGGWQVVERIRLGKPVIVMGDGTSLWTITHSRDLAKGFVGLMGNIHAIGEAFHITSDESITWNQAYECIGRAFNVKPNIVHIPTDYLAKLDPEYLGSLKGDKANSVIFDNSKIKRFVPGYCADIRYDQGIKMSIDFITAHPKYQSADPDFDEWVDDLVTHYCKNLDLESTINLITKKLQWL